MVGLAAEAIKDAMAKLPAGDEVDIVGLEEAAKITKRGFFNSLAPTGAASLMEHAVIVCRDRDGECPNPAKCKADGCPYRLNPN